MLCSLFLFRLITLDILYTVYGQSSQWMDTFQRDLCRERWNRMDWQGMLRPCKDNLEFGENKLSESLKTSPKYSHILRMDIRKTGEFSKIAIQSRTTEGRVKTVGGDTWRIFVRGPSFITPFVTDLGNGVYQAAFMIMEPGFYKAEINLENSLCNSYKDPPKNWLKQGETSGHSVTERTLSKEQKPSKLWEPLRGGEVSFKVEPSDPAYLKDLQKSMNRWKDSCGPQYKCDMLWNGFGRWVNATWKPYIEDLEIPGSEEDRSEETNKRCLRKGKGTMFLDDCLGNDFFKYAWNRTLCTDVFDHCEKDGACMIQILQELELKPASLKIKRTGGVASRIINTVITHRYRKGNSNSAEAGKCTQKDTTSPDENPKFSAKDILKNLRQHLHTKGLDENSAVLLNYGLEFVKRMSFKNFRRFMDSVAKSLKEYKGQPVWRTIPSKWKPNADASKKFENYQRTLLFNAYATSKMCQQGYPAVDVFQLTGSLPRQPEEANHYDVSIFKPMEKMLSEYFQSRKDKGCSIRLSEKRFRKKKDEEKKSDVENLENGKTNSTDENNTREQNVNQTDMTVGTNSATINQIKVNPKEKSETVANAES